MLGLGNMFEHGWGIEQDTEVAKRWYAKARAAGTKGASIRMRQMKADAAGAAESSPSTANGPTAHSQPLQAAAPFTDSSGVQTEQGGNLARQLSNKEPAEGRTSNQSSTETSNVKDFLETQAKDYLTPAALLILGLFMGFLVFRWMKGSNHHDSAF